MFIEDILEHALSIVTNWHDTYLIHGDKVGEWILLQNGTSVFDGVSYIFKEIFNLWLRNYCFSMSSNPLQPRAAPTSLAKVVPFSGWHLLPPLRSLLRGYPRRSLGTATADILRLFVVVLFIHSEEALPPVTAWGTS
jgi:hypothetical protein